MRPRFAAVLLIALALAGCQKFQSLEKTSTVELKAQEVKTPFILDPMDGERAVSVTVTCDSNVQGFLVKGPTEEIMARLSNGQDPKAGTTIGQLGGKGGTVGFDLRANEQFSLILRNPGNKPIMAEAKLSSKSK